MPDQQQTLNHALSFGGASAISTGLAFAAINFLGIAQMLGYVRGPLAWAAVLCAGLVILAVRALFSELNGMYPTAAGIRLWMARAMNDRLALIITFTYMAATRSSSARPSPTRSATAAPSPSSTSRRCSGSPPG
jgi:basic amino acid/polyamine antiporter, APA family